MGTTSKANLQGAIFAGCKLEVAWIAGAPIDEAILSEDTV